MTCSSADDKHTMAREILDVLPISGVVGNIHVEEVDSPWSEKVTRIKGKNGYTDIRLTLWKSDAFLYGRIYRLFLYVCDVFDGHFQYDSTRIPHGTNEPKIRETYNHIWGIYVDSRIEKMEIENFFDKTLRRNLFVDSQKNLPWTISTLFFNRLWNKKIYIHSELTDFAYNLDKLAEGDDNTSFDAFEIEIGRSLMSHTARKHVDNIASNDLRDIAHTILDFTTGHCRGTLIESSYYGIYFMYDREIFMEMATTKADVLLITLFDFQSNMHRTHTVMKNTEEISAIQHEAKAIYDRIANHSRLKAIKNPYTAAVEK